MTNRTLASRRRGRKASPSGAAALSEGWRPSIAGSANIRARIRRLSAALASRHGTPDLGNIPQPLDEAIYIVITYQTDVVRARTVWSSLKRAFPSWQALLDAPEHDVSEVLRPSGLHRARARVLRSLLRAVTRRWGVLSLDALETMSDSAAEAELRALPGLNIKGARCVLLYSLGRNVFPVDSNVFRFMMRYGILPRTSRYRRRSVHDAVQGIVPESERHRLHVNLVVHGQTTCLPRYPRCASCCVRRRCQASRLPTGVGPDRR